jgi:hypothetical protein
MAERTSPAKAKPNHFADVSRLARRGSLDPAETVGPILLSHASLILEHMDSQITQEPNGQNQIFD